MVSDENSEKDMEVCSVPKSTEGEEKEMRGVDELHAERMASESV